MCTCAWMHGLGDIPTVNYLFNGGEGGRERETGREGGREGETGREREREICPLT